MKKLFILIGLISMAWSTHAQVGEYIITSSIQDLRDSTFSMTIWDGSSQTRSAQGTMQNGQIYYKDTTSLPLVIRITLPTKELYKQADGGYFPVKSQSIWLIASPGKTVHLTGYLSDFAEVYPSGDEENKILSDFTKTYHPLLNASVNISVDLNVNGKSMDSLRVQQLEQEQRVIDAKARQCMESFLKQYTSSIAGLYYMNDMLLRRMVTVEMAEELLPKVATSYKNTTYYQTVARRIEGSRFDVGRPMFTVKSTNTYDGKAFSSDNWKGRFYLIDFWGSWCGPCMADVPDLKKLKETYPDQLQVLGIASDKEPNWRKAIVDHNLDWTQILNGTSDQDFVSRLNVTGFPTKILVDPNGQIAYRSTGGGETSFKKMAEIIKNWKK